MTGIPSNRTRSFPRLRLTDPIFAALLGVVFFALTLTSSSIPGGDDAYRHVRFAHRLITGPAAALADPWRIPFLWPKPVDIWFGFHMLLAPFTLILPLILAAKVLGAALWAAGLWAVLKLLDSVKAGWPRAWLILAAAGSAIVFYRATLARPFLLSLLLVMLATRYTIEEKPLRLALVSALHALSYSIFFMPALPAGLYLLIRRSGASVRLAVSCALGLCAGVLANPFFPENFKFSLIQAYTRLGPDLSKTLDIGGELRPLSVWWLAASLPVLAVWIPAVVLLIGLWGWKKPREKPSDAQLVLLAMSLVALAMSLHAARMFDFFVPIAVVFAASVLSPLLAPRREPAAYAFGFLCLLCAAGLVPAFATVRSAPSVYRYQAASEYLAAQGDGAIVFNTHWEQYPFLYFWNTRSRYVTGLDPSFLYFNSQVRSGLWRQISDDVLVDPERVQQVVSREFGARYILVDQDLNPKLIQSLRTGVNFCEVFHDSGISVFEIGAGHPGATQSSAAPLGGPSPVLR